MERKQALQVLQERRARGLSTVSVFTFRALTEEERKDLIVDNQLRNYSQTPKLTPEEKAHNKEVCERFGIVPGYRFQVVKGRKCIGFFKNKGDALRHCSELDDLAIWADDRQCYISLLTFKACSGIDRLSVLKWHKEKDAILIDYE